MKPEVSGCPHQWKTVVIQDWVGYGMDAEEIEYAYLECKLCGKEKEWKDECECCGQAIE